MDLLGSKAIYRAQCRERTKILWRQGYGFDKDAWEKELDALPDSKICRPADGVILSQRECQSKETHQSSRSRLLKQCEKKGWAATRRNLKETAATGFRIENAVLRQKFLHLWFPSLCC